jgi:hypothetical protein
MVQKMIIFNIILTFFLNFSLSTLWGMIHSLSMIIYISLFNLTFPANFNVINKHLIQIVTFDMLPFIDEINQFLFTTYYSEGSIKNRAIGFELLGFETHNFAKNIGSLYIFIIFVTITSISSLILRQFALNFICVKFYRKFRMNENLNAILFKVVLEAYFELLVTCYHTV